MILQIITEIIILQKKRTSNYRNYNITKKEDIINGDIVKYVNYQYIESYFDYDFKEENNELKNRDLYIKENLPPKR